MKRRLKLGSITYIVKLLKVVTDSVMQPERRGGRVLVGSGGWLGRLVEVVNSSSVGM